MAPPRSATCVLHVISLRGLTHAQVHQGRCAEPLLPPACRNWEVYTQLQGNPTWTCFVGFSSYTYGNFIGNISSWTHMTTWSSLYYNTTGNRWYGWNNAAACSTAYRAVCEIPVGQFACPTSPPPARPPPPRGILCELPAAAMCPVVRPPWSCDACNVWQVNSAR
jgi:hypothetical protein